MQAVATGIIGGVIAAFLVFLWRAIWVKSLVPWYEERIYKDAKIDGQWVITCPDAEEWKELVTLHQVAHRVTGLVAVAQGPDEGKTYEFNGSFRNLILTLEYNSTEKSALDRGTYTVILRKNGKQFVGNSASYEDGSNEIISFKCIWDRPSDYSHTEVRQPEARADSIPKRVEQEGDFHFSLTSNSSGW